MSKGTGEHFSVAPCILWTTVISTNNYHHNPKVVFEFQSDDVSNSVMLECLKGSLRKLVVHSHYPGLHF